MQNEERNGLPSDAVPLIEAAQMTGKSIHTMAWLIKTQKVRKYPGNHNGRQVTMVSAKEVLDYYGMAAVQQVPVRQADAAEAAAPVAQPAAHTWTPEMYLELEEKLEKRVEERYSSKLQESSDVIRRLEAQRENLQQIIIEEKSQKGAMAGELQYLRERIHLLEATNIPTPTDAGWEKWKPLATKVAIGIGAGGVLVALLAWILWPALALLK